MKTAYALLALICTLASASAGPDGSTSQKAVEVQSVLLTLVEQVSVPAREAGVLTHVEVQEGRLVEEGAFLAQVDDRDAQLAAERANIETEIAAKKAENDVSVRFAGKSAEVARTELKRSLEAVELFRKSVSDTEIDRLRLSAERAELEIEQAEHNRQVDQLTTRLKEVAYQEALGDVERRKILAPISGVVVEVNRHRGEWVEPGETVMRILRVDRLRAEGFLELSVITGDLTGRLVTLRVDLPGRPAATFPGRLTFVSPEVDPVNGQVRVRAEIENRDLQLRPGLQASMTIEPAKKQEE